MPLLRQLRVAIILLMLGSVVYAAEGGFGLFPRQIASEPDPVSAGCIACHDGTAGWRVRYSLPSPIRQGCSGHIISADYAALTAKNKNLRPPESLPQELTFHEGKITCVTCHGDDPHNVLAIDNTHSALCRACHLK